MSLVLNDHPSIPETTRARVKQAAVEVGYVYNRRAASLRSKKSGLIAIAINDLESPYFAEVVAGAQAELEAQGFMTILSNSGEDAEKQKNFLMRIREFAVDGVLVCPAAGAQTNMIEDIQVWSKSIVVFSRPLDGMVVDFVGGDNFLGMGLIMDHLIERGHRQIAHIGYNPLVSTSRDRVRCFQERMSSIGRDVPPELVIACDATREGGYIAMKDLLRSQIKVTAVACHNDVLAFGAMLAMQEAGIVPGKDISITGSDNVSEATLWNPGLTTVDVPRGDLGRRAARILVEKLKSPNVPIVSEWIEPRLIIRGSSDALVRE